MSDTKEEMGRDEVVMRAVITVFVLFGISVSFASQFTSMISTDFLYLIGACSLGLICVDWVLTWGTDFSRLKRFILRRSPLLLLSVAICAEFLLRQSIVYQSLVHYSSALSDNILLFTENRIRGSFIYFAAFSVLPGLILGFTLSKLRLSTPDPEPTPNPTSLGQKLYNKTFRIHLENATVAAFEKYPIRLAGQADSSRRWQLGMVAGIAMVLILWIAAMTATHLFPAFNNDMEIGLVYIPILIAGYFFALYIGRFQSHFF